MYVYDEGARVSHPVHRVKFITGNYMPQHYSDPLLRTCLKFANTNFSYATNVASREFRRVDNARA